MRLHWFALPGLLTACADLPDYSEADLQVDLPGDIPLDAETVRICVSGVGSHAYGARAAGRFAMTGIPTDRVVDVTLDVLGVDEALLVQGFATGVDGWIEGERVECDGDCTPCGATGNFVDPGEDSWLLAVRFSG